MKRIGIALATLALAACHDPPPHVLQGYGEAEYTYIASQETGILQDVAVSEGDHVDAGATLFRLSPERLNLNAASAASTESAALARTQPGGALAQAVQAAEAEAQLAQSNLARSEDLFQRGFLSRARLDADQAARDAAVAQVAQARAEWNAARRDVGAAHAATRLARTRVSDLDGQAPSAGTIERIYHRPGEVVAAGAPIISLLTPDNMKIRFFAPEPLLARLRLGAEVRIHCDGCADGLSARISYIATEPQFTPPIIYSADERDKLVFLIEARLNQPDAIRPGMPVDIIAP